MSDPYPPVAGHTYSTYQLAKDAELERLRATIAAVRAKCTEIPSLMPSSGLAQSILSILDRNGHR